jgi:hypothetical protein
VSKLTQGDALGWDGVAPLALDSRFPDGNDKQKNKSKRVFRGMNAPAPSGFGLGANGFAWPLSLAWFGGWRNPHLRIEMWGTLFVVGARLLSQAG